MWPNERDVFEALNQGLSEHGMELDVICVGGFVLSHHGMRATQDVDGFFRTNALIDSIIAEVGDRFGINTEDEPWLKNSVQSMNAWPDKGICDLLYDFSNLKVYLAPLDYVACMKLVSCRGQDILDVASIVKREGIADPEALRSTLREYGFGDPDESLVLEAFGKAYGMGWLEAYYVEHEEEILKRL